MDTWIFIASLKQFKVHNFIKDYGFIEYLQKNNVHVGDIVYLYITAPFSRVEYKMVVERVNIPPSEAFDDRHYSLKSNPQLPYADEKIVRLKLVGRVKTDNLEYKKLQEHGFNLTMQSNRRITNEKIIDYIEDFFN